MELPESAGEHFEPTEHAGTWKAHSSFDSVSTWIETLSPTFFFFRGDFRGDSLERKGRALDRMSQREADDRTTEVHERPDERVFEMFPTMPDGTDLERRPHVETRA